ncbi:MAG: T9SS type A sorting domain-containing protein [Crocinitomix sp.]|nr:T9SS type A sorting domain-containing protein [Crocinitomix sp.]
MITIRADWVKDVFSTYLDGDGWEEGDHGEDDNGIYEDVESSGLENNSFEAELAIYPNPISTDILTIDFGTKRNNVSLVLSSLNGQEIITCLVAEKTSKAQLNVDDLTPDVYLLIINHDNGSLAKKIIIN